MEQATVGKIQSWVIHHLLSLEFVLFYVTQQMVAHNKFMATRPL